MFDKLHTLFCVLAIFALLVSTASAEMKIFELQHRPVAELEDTVRQMVSPGAKVAAHGNTLVVNTTPGELAEIAKLVKSYDKPVRMLRITVDQQRSVSASQRELRAGARVSSEDVKIRAGRPQGVFGNSVFVSTGDADVLITGGAGDLKEKQSARHFLNVLEGAPASISVGQAIPYTSELRYYSRRHPHYVETVEYQNVDTGFEVLPEVYGEMVDLSIRPYMSFPHRQNPHYIVFHDMDTRVRVPFGAWYELGGSTEGLNALSREILGFGSTSGTKSNKIRLRVDPQ